MWLLIHWESLCKRRFLLHGRFYLWELKNILTSVRDILTYISRIEVFRLDHKDGFGPAPLMEQERWLLRRELFESPLELWTNWVDVKQRSRLPSFRETPFSSNDNEGLMRGRKQLRRKDIPISLKSTRAHLRNKFSKLLKCESSIVLWTYLVSF